MCAIFGMVIKEFDPKMIEDFFLRFSHLQHRGQESVGVSYTDGKTVWTEKKMGLIPNLLTSDVKEKMISRKPLMMIGQTRYSTSGDKSARDMPPQWLDTLGGRYALVHNGNIPELESHKKPLEESGVCFHTDLDTEFMLKKIIFLSNDRRMEFAISDFMQTTGGSFSSALMSKDCIFVFRDKRGNRPLFISQSTNGCTFFGSETCAFEKLKDVRAVGPGDIYMLDIKGPISNFKLMKKIQKAHCVFEKIYFARPDSRTFSSEIEGMFRFRLGRKLAKQHPVSNADVIVPMPDSGRSAAEGYAFEIGKPIISAFVRDRYYIKRNFINPPGQRRSDLKYHLMGDFVRGKAVVLIDDSIVRGDTLKSQVKKLKKAGAREVHIRVSSPKLTSPCYYGIDIPTSDEIIGSDKTVEQIREFLDADSLKYLEEIFLREVLAEGGEDFNQFCMACFNGEYPIPLEIPL